MHLPVALALQAAFPVMRPRLVQGTALLRRARASPPAIMMTLSKASLHYEFEHIPYAAGIQHIHSPEHMSATHRLGAQLFQIDRVDRPDLSQADRTSIAFVCSTPFIRGMRVRMFARQPNESNLLFFKDGRALYGVKLTVTPTKAFLSHRLRLDVSFFTGGAAFRTTLKSLLPLFMFVNRMEDDPCAAPAAFKENANFTEYRRGVLRGKGSDEYWIMAERVLSEYTR